MGGQLLAPQIAATPRAVYSFQDVLALRTFVRLREHASLQKIRAAIGNLRDIGEAGHLASYRLVSDQRGNIQLLTEDQAMNLGDQPGQLQLVAVIGEIIEPFAVRAGVLVPHLLRPRPGLSVDPETQGGTPVITGTRVPYDTVSGLMRDGVPADRIGEYFPSAGADAASDALDFARYVDSFEPASRAALCACLSTKTLPCRSPGRCGTCCSATRSRTSPSCPGRARRTSGSATGTSSRRWAAGQPKT